MSNLKYQPALKGLHEKQHAIITKGKYAGRSVKIISESAYRDNLVVWKIEFVIKRHGDEINPSCCEDRLMSIWSPIAESKFNERKF